MKKTCSLNVKFGGRSFSLSCHLTGNPESGAADGYCNFGNLEIMKTFSNKGIAREWRLTKLSSVRYNSTIERIA